jgi:hypothetical protein
VGARQKLNAAHWNGNIILAGLAGACTESWLVFFVGLGLLLALDLYSGGIRSKKRDR